MGTTILIPRDLEVNKGTGTSNVIEIDVPVFNHVFFMFPFNIVNCLALKSLPDT